MSCYKLCDICSPETGETIADDGHIDDLNVDDDDDDDNIMDDDDNRPRSVEVRIDIEQLTVEQHRFLKLVKDCAIKGIGHMIILDAPAGHGKSHVLKAIHQEFGDMQKRGCDAWKMKLNIVTTATTGAAATLLPNGRTAHTTFKLPLCELTATTTLKITRQSILGRALQIAGLIIVDEASMLTKHQLDAIDRAMQVSCVCYYINVLSIFVQDLKRSNEPFGGATILLSCDMRQTLPVMPGANTARVLANLFTKSNAWQRVSTTFLIENIED